MDQSARPTGWRPANGKARTTIWLGTGICADRIFVVSNVLDSNILRLTIRITGSADGSDLSVACSVVNLIRGHI